MSSSSDPNGRPSTFSGRTAWARSVGTPLRDFLRTETGGAAVLLAAAVAALVWVNIDASSYESLWHTGLSVRVGDPNGAPGLPPLGDSGAGAVFFFGGGVGARRRVV